MPLYDEAQALARAKVDDTVAALEAELAAVTLERDTALLDLESVENALEQVTEERDSLQAEYDAHMATHEPTEPPPPPPPPPPPTGARFAGDPGVGNLLVGNNGEGNVKIDTLDTLAGIKHSTIRVYNGANLVLGSGVRADLTRYANEGRIPMFSTKYGGLSPAQLAAGAADTEWRATARWLADVYPGVMWYSPVGHEPEDNFPAGSSADSYRAAFRRAVATHVDERPGIANKVAFCAPWFMEFTYDGSRDYRNWHPNWSGTQWLHDGPFDVLCTDGSTYFGSWIHMDAIDLYNPGTGPGTSARNQTWAGSIDAFLGDRVQRNQPPLPWCIGEYGLYDNPNTLDDNGVTLTQILNGTLNTGAARDGLTGIALWTNSQAFMDAASPKTVAWREFVKDSRVLKAGWLG